MQTARPARYQNPDSTELRLLATEAAFRITRRIAANR
jgi:hypothetical protein